MPAGLRYDGPAWRVLRAGLRGIDCRGAARPEVAILSAEFGFVADDLPIPDYDRMMDRGRGVEISSDPEQREALARLLGHADEVFLGGGGLYRRVARACLEANGFRGCVVEPVKPRGVGDLLAALRGYLAA